MLKFDNVTFKYESDDYEMIKDLSFDVKDGEFISLIGASGCGKSTAFRLINGLEKPQSGSITINGTPIKELKNYSSYMPQKDLLYPWRTIEKNVCLPMELRKESKEKCFINDYFQNLKIQRKRLCKWFSVSGLCLLRTFFFCLL